MRTLRVLIFNLILVLATLVQGAPSDVVFDLDWTLFYQVNSPQNLTDVQRVTQFNDHVYHLADSSEEVLGYLQNEGLRISFFSGGDPTRNQHLVRFLKEKFYERTGKTLKIYKILNFNDLTRTPAPETARFSDRYKKDLSKINQDTAKVFIFDDIQSFVPETQKSQMIWLGQTFNDLPQFPKNPSHEFLADEFNPKSEKEWFIERNKLLRALELFAYKSANKVASENDLQLIELGKLRIKNSNILSCKKILI